MLARIARYTRPTTALLAAQVTRKHALPLVGGAAGALSGAWLMTTSRCEGDDHSGGAKAAAGPTLLQKCVAEAIGTGMIVAGGCGVVCALKYAGHPITPLGIGAAFGVSVTLAIYATAGISGAHLNPAVTLSKVVSGAMDAAEAGPYMAAQVFGGAVAAGFNYIAFSGGIAAMEAKDGIKRGACAAGANVFGGAFGMVPNKAICSVPRALLVETAITACLVYCIYAFTDPNNKLAADGAAPALIGSTVAVFVHNFAPVTGAGMNPARDLGPRIVTLCTGWGTTALSTGWWVYTVGPLLGGVLGGLAYAATLGAGHAKK